MNVLPQHNSPADNRYAPRNYGCKQDPPGPEWVVHGQCRSSGISLCIVERQIKGYPEPSATPKSLLPSLPTERFGATDQRSTFRISQFVGEVNKFMKQHLTIRFLGDLRLCLRHPGSGALGGPSGRDLAAMKLAAMNEIAAMNEMSKS